MRCANAWRAFPLCGPSNAEPRSSVRLASGAAMLAGVAEAVACESEPAARSGWNRSDRRCPTTPETAGCAGLPWRCSLAEDDGVSHQPSATMHRTSAARHAHMHAIVSTARRSLAITQPCSRYAHINMCRVTVSGLSQNVYACTPPADPTRQPCKPDAPNHSALLLSQHP